MSQHRSVATAGPLASTYVCEKGHRTHLSGQFRPAEILCLDPTCLKLAVKEGAKPEGIEEETK